MEKVYELAKDGKINLFTKYQLKSVNGKENLESIDVIYMMKKRLKI